MRILLVEDDKETASFICDGLRQAGEQVDHVDDPRQGLMQAAAQPYDAIVFDRLLPGMDGLDAIRVLRASRVETPVLVLTALSGIDDRVQGLDAGADDYLVKPFAFSELHARLRALGRRKPLQEEEPARLEAGPLTLDRLSRRVRRGEAELNLLPREYALLEYLMRHAGRTVTRTMLLEAVWGYRFDPKTSLVQTHMSRLRAKVDRPFDTELIRTVRGAGYVLDA